MTESRVERLTFDRTRSLGASAASRDTAAGICGRSGFDSLHTALVNTAQTTDYGSMVLTQRGVCVYSGDEQGSNRRGNIRGNDRKLLWQFEHKAEEDCSQHDEEDGADDQHNEKQTRSGKFRDSSDD